MISHDDFIKKILPAAVDGFNEYGILPSVTLAQAVLESTWGKNNIKNNLFGIKANKGWTGGKVAKVTTEYINGSKQKTVAYFRTYSSFAESVLDHCRLLGEAERYKKVRSANDYKEACVALQEAGYATDPNYAQKLIKIIEKNNFMQYDKVHWAEKFFQDLLKKGIEIHEKRFDDPATRGEVFRLLDLVLNKLLTPTQ